MGYQNGTPSLGKAPLVRKIGLTSWSVETTPHLGTVLLARRIGQKAWVGVLPTHPSRSDDHERKVLSVYAAALHCGLCHGLPRSVYRDGARGWYSVFCRRWCLRLVCTKVDAGKKEVKKASLHAR